MLRELEDGFGRLQEGRSELCERVRALSPEARLRSLREDAWSPLQVLEHVMLVEWGTVRYISSGREPGPRTLKSAVLKLTLRAFFALGGKAKVPVPALLPKETPDFEEVERRWAEVHRELEAFLEGVTPETLRQPVFRHPLVGPMDNLETLAFLLRHLRHHQRQL